LLASADTGLSTASSSGINGAAQHAKTVPASDEGVRLLGTTAVAFMQKKTSGQLGTQPGIVTVEGGTDMSAFLRNSYTLLPSIATGRGTNPAQKPHGVFS